MAQPPVTILTPFNGANYIEVYEATALYSTLLAAGVFPGYGLAHMVLDATDLAAVFPDGPPAPHRTPRDGGGQPVGPGHYEMYAPTGFNAVSEGSVWNSCNEGKFWRVTRRT